MSHLKRRACFITSKLSPAQSKPVTAARLPQNKRKMRDKNNWTVWSSHLQPKHCYNYLNIVSEVLHMNPRNRFKRISKVYLHRFQDDWVFFNKNRPLQNYFVKNLSKRHNVSWRLPEIRKKSTKLKLLMCHNVEVPGKSWRCILPLW